MVSKREFYLGVNAECEMVGFEDGIRESAREVGKDLLNVLVDHFYFDEMPLC